MSPFALQLCHGGAVDVDGGGVVSASAVHVYGVGEVRVGRGALHADAAGCRAGEGEGRGESFRRRRRRRRGIRRRRETGSRLTVRVRC